MSNSINILKREKFLDEFQNNAIERFGFLTKNEYEVFIYHLLDKYSDLSDKSFFEQSIMLRIPESKVKRLSYEANLKYVKYDRAAVLKDFFQIISHSKFDADGKNIRFAVPNKYIRTSIQAEVYKTGAIFDGSFNSDIVSINIDAFVSLLKKLFEDTNQLRRIESECNKAIRKNEEKEFSWGEFANSFVYGTAEAIPSLILEIIQNISAPITIAKSIIKFIAMANSKQ